MKSDPAVTLLRYTLVSFELYLETRSFYSNSFRTAHFETLSLLEQVFDPDGIYIRLYVPELTSVPTQATPYVRDEQDRYGYHIGIAYPVSYRGSLAGTSGALRTGQVPGDEMTTFPIRLGISRCLLGDEVRFGGGHKRDHFVTDALGRYVEWVPICPEVEAGLASS